VRALLRAGEKVGAYRYDGLWFDIGRRDDYEQAVAAWADTASSAAPQQAVAAMAAGKA
jgi:NDP-sugar pyrophosphorylase family protein